MCFEYIPAVLSKCLIFCLVAFIPTFSSAFDLLPKALTDKDIKQYIKAYNNIAKISPQIKLEREKIVKRKNIEEKCRNLIPETADFNKALCRDLDVGVELFALCKPCQSLVTQAVMDAGYKNYISFLYMDVRIHIAMYYYAELQMAKFVGELGVKLTTRKSKDGVSTELFCKQLNDKNNQKNMSQPEKDIQNTIQVNADKEQLENIHKYCDRMNIFGGYLQKISKTVVKLAEKLLKKGDIARVEQSYDDIIEALTNVDLDSRYKHSMGGGGFDD